MKKLMLALFVCVIGILSIPGRSFSADTLLIADFESHPNNLGGEVGVYGSLEPNWDDKATPYSWYYTKDVPGYDAINAHGGKQSFRLVNALGSKKAETWGSFSADLGQVTDAVPVPKRMVEPIILRMKNDAYEEATRMVKHIGELMCGLGRHAEFAAYLADVKLRHKPKRNLMKLLAGV